MFIKKIQIANNIILLNLIINIVLDFLYFILPLTISNVFHRYKKVITFIILYFQFKENSLILLTDSFLYNVSAINLYVPSELGSVKSKSVMSLPKLKTLIFFSKD